jgi:hypothetical protein
MSILVRTKVALFPIGSLANVYDVPANYQGASMCSHRARPSGIDLREVGAKGTYPIGLRVTFAWAKST